MTGHLPRVVAVVLIVLSRAALATAETPGDVDAQVSFAVPRVPADSWLGPVGGQRTRQIGPALAGPRTIPFFDGSFAVGGQTFPFRIVGTDPATAPATTVVRTVVVPLRFVFANGKVFDPRSTIGALRASPLFRPSSFLTGDTQYGDAIQRAEFWQQVQGTSYHVLLHRPTITRTLVVHVPAAQGLTATSHYGGAVGVVSQAFLSQLVPTVVNRLRLSPSKLLVLWSYNVDVQVQLNQGGVILGEHSAGTNSTHSRVWTWAWASWHTADTILPGSEDVAVLSHEIAEWLNDPFTTNVVPPWEAPPSYPCSTGLEVGDPLVGVTFAQGSYHLQDEAFLAWFEHASPSPGYGGRYSYLGTLTAPSAGCTP